MADKSIRDLNNAPGTVDDSNTLFVVDQNGTAYKLDGHAFILALTAILDGHGGIKSITGPTTVGLVDTYTITFADDTTSSFGVTNGKGIANISKTGTSGLVDTYTITYNDGSTPTTFTVTNGEKGDTGDAWYVWIRYSGSQPTQDSDMGTTPDNWMGIYSGTSSTAPTHYTDYDWFQIKGEKGDTGAASTVTDLSVTYQEGQSGSVAPSGSWTTTIPAVAQGNYLWTKIQVTFNSGSPMVYYSVARMGVDGSGSVSSVNGQSPDGNGNVVVDASNIPTEDNTSVQEKLTDLRNTLTQLDGRLDTVETNISIKNVTITPNDPATVVYESNLLEFNGLILGVYRTGAYRTAGNVYYGTSDIHPRYTICGVLFDGPAKGVVVGGYVWNTDGTIYINPNGTGYGFSFCI